MRRLQSFPICALIEINLEFNQSNKVAEQQQLQKRQMVMQSSAASTIPVVQKSQNQNHLLQPQSNPHELRTSDMTKLEKINLDDLPILKDKEFYDCLLQCLTEHHSEYENVTCRPEFTEEFLANYWLQLMKNAHFKYVPEVTVDDKGFDSIHRSVFEICESRIDLRVTTGFALDCKKLADDKQIQSRNLFMLILLFISEWIEYHKENYPLFSLSKHNPDVNECFNKLFKKIYQGTDKNFEGYVFERQNNFSILNQFQALQNEIQDEANDKIKEVEDFNTSFAYTIKEKTHLQQELSKAKTELAESQILLSQKDAEIKSIREELLNALSNDRVKEENQKLVRSLDEKNAELEQLKNLLSKVQAELRVVTTQLRDLQKSKFEFETEFDAFKNSFDENTNLIYNKWTDVKTLIDDLAAERQHNLSLTNQLQEMHEEFEDRTNANIKEMKYLNKAFADTIEKNKHLQQELSQAKNELEESKVIFSQKDAEIENIRKKLLDALSQNDRLKEENEELSKTVNRKSLNEERNEEIIQKRDRSLDEKNTELEQLKTLLSKVQAELRVVLTQLRDLQESKSEIEDEFGAFKNSFGENTALISDKWTDMKTLIDNLAAERQQNLSLKNQLQELQEQIEDRANANIKEMEDLNKAFADTIEKNKHLQQELSRAKNELEESKIFLSQKDAEIENINNQIQSLNGLVNKLQMDNDLINEELLNALSQKDHLTEENEQLSKTVNRKSRNEERNEEIIQKRDRSLDQKNAELEQLKNLLSKVQAELRVVLAQLRDLQKSKFELETEFDAFKNSFDENTTSFYNKWTDVKTLVDDLAAERQHNLSLTNQLQELQEEVSSRERSRTPSLHDEGVRGCNSRRTSFTGPPLFDVGNASELFSEPFDEADEMRLDSGFGSTETSPRDVTAAVVPAANQSFIRRSVSSVPNWIMFLSSFIILFTIYLHLVGAIVPSWIYIKVHHDEMPPQ